MRLSSMIAYDPRSKIYSSNLINNELVRSGFATKFQGDARKISNLERFFKSQNLVYRKLVLLEQIHSINIRVIRDIDSLTDYLKIPETDGVITSNKGLVLTVRNADCLPVIYFDSVRELIGISHQGWRGSLKNLAGKMINKFRELKSDPGDLRCALGPGIGVCCYSIDSDRYVDYLDAYDRFADKIFQKRAGNWHLNLSYLNYLQLCEAGLSPSQIDFFPFCTKCDKSRFFSRRRSKSRDFAEMFNFILKFE